MRTQSDLNSLIAEAEENAQKLVLKNYIPTLIIITCFLVFISLFGLIGNWLVVHTIGRHIFRRFFHFLEYCLRLLCICCRRNKRLEYHQTQLHIYQCRDNVNQNPISNCLDVKNRFRSPSLVPLGHLSNYTEQHEQCSMNNPMNGSPKIIIQQQTIEGSTECLGSRRNIQRYSSVKRPTTQTNLNSDLLIVLLAVNDLIICAIDIPTTIFLIVWETRTYDFMCRLHVTLKAFTLTVSALFLVIIALDRWLLICFIPCVIMSKRCLMKLIIGTYILGFLWAIPMGLHQGVHTYFKISTVDKLVPNDIETYIMSQESSSVMSSSPSVTPTKHSSSSSSSSSFAYISSKFIDLVTSFTNYGYCKSDERFISNKAYEIYQMSILLLFAFIFTCICLFYGYLFSFIMIHHYRWKTKFGPRTILINKSINHEIIIATENSINNSPDNFNPMHINQSVKNITEYKYNRERCSSVQIEEMNNISTEAAAEASGTAASQQDQPNQRIRHSDPSIYTNLQIINHQQKNHIDNIQPHISITKPDDNIQNKHIPEKRSPLFKSLKKSTRTRLSHNRHLRSAITFILITVSFLISYLPSLLIANGFIWPVKWELSTDITEQAFNYYSIKNMTIQQIDTFENSVNNSRFNSTSRLLINSNYQAVQYNEHNNTTTTTNNNSSIISHNEIKYHLRRLFHFLYFINSAANPLIYFFFNLKFRAALKRLLTSMSSCFILKN